MFFDDGCGGYSLWEEPEKLVEDFQIKLDLTGNHDPNYNIRPSSLDPVVYEANNVRTMELMRWGLVPGWYKGDPKKVMFANINARAETVDVKPFFRGPFKYHRCLIPANSFFEWALDPVDPKIKHPVLFEMKNKKPFVFAGIFDIWHDVEEREMKTFSLLTCEPNETVNVFHSRMPVVLEEKNYKIWLDPEFQDTRELKKLCQPYPDKEMDFHFVSREVSNSRNNGPELINPIPQVKTKQSQPAWQKD